jgi:hypothetical protein
LYEEARANAVGDDRSYEEWIQAYALMVDKKDRYEFYKNKILNAETMAEKDVVLSVIYARAQYEKEYEVYSAMVDKDKQIKESIKE